VWGEKSSAVIRIRSDGTIEGILNGYMHGNYQRGKLKVTPVMYVNFIADSMLVISLNSVSKYAKLVVSIDGT
jgi:hypothetical protein